MTKRPTYPKGREQMPEADVVKRANGLATQRLLLSAAGSIFSRMPYAEARLKDIADEADISPGSLYFHFGNKDDIAKAVISIQQERMGRFWSERTPQGEPLSTDCSKSWKDSLSSSPPTNWFKQESAYPCNQTPEPTSTWAPRTLHGKA